MNFNASIYTICITIAATSQYVQKSILLHYVLYIMQGNSTIFNAKLVTNNVKNALYTIVKFETFLD